MFGYLNYTLKQETQKVTKYIFSFNFVNYGSRGIRVNSSSTGYLGYYEINYERVCEFYDLSYVFSPKRCMTKVESIDFINIIRIDKNDSKNLYFYRKNMELQSF